MNSETWITTRPERPGDESSIERLTIEAFAGTEFGHQGEAELVAQLRDQCSNILSLVACERDEVVGHLLLSEAWIRSDSDAVRGMGLAPMSVTPQRQKSGIGAALIQHSLQLLREQNCPFVVVLGHPTYYPRFGFSPASTWSLQHGFAGIPQDVFFAQVFDTEQSIEGGKVYYRDEFGPQWT